MDEFTLLSASWVIRARWRESKRFVWKFETMKSIHDVQFCFFFYFPKQKICSQWVRKNIVRENGCCRDFIKQSFRHTFPVIPKAQNDRECMETKMQYLGITKRRYQVHFISVVNLKCLPSSTPTVCMRR